MAVMDMQGWKVAPCKVLYPLVLLSCFDVWVPFCPPLPPVSSDGRTPNGGGEQLEIKRPAVTKFSQIRSKHWLLGLLYMAKMMLHGAKTSASYACRKTLHNTSSNQLWTRFRLGHMQAILGYPTVEGENSMKYTWFNALYQELKIEMGCIHPGTSYGCKVRPKQKFK